VLVVVARRGEQVSDVLIVQGVVSVTPGAAHPYEPQRAQDAQVVRGRARRQSCRLGELLDATLAVQQLDEQPHPTRRAERLERLGKLLGLEVRQGPRGAVLGWMRHEPILAIYEQVLTYHWRGRFQCPAISLLAPAPAFAQTLIDDNDPNARCSTASPWGSGTWSAAGHLPFITGVLILAGDMARRPSARERLQANEVPVRLPSSR
jgi:hypothetical protein